MEVIVRLFVSIVFTAIQGVYRLFKMPGWKRQWAAAAEILGYANTSGLTLHGREDDLLDVAVGTVLRGDGNSTRLFTRIAVSGPAIPQSLSIGAEGFFSRTFKSDDIQIGHPETDDALRIQGDEAEALAVLGADTRKRLVTAIKREAWVIDNGTCAHEIKGVLDTEALVAAVRDAMEVVGHFRTDLHTIDERLRDNAAGDPVADVRLRNLEVLGQRATRSASARRLAEEAAASAIADPDDRIRLAAALISDDDGVFQQLLDQVDRLSEATARRLVETLRSRALPGRDAALLVLLTHKVLDVRLAACRTLGDVGQLAAVEGLLGLAKKRFGGGDLKQAARDAIAAIQAREANTNARGGLTLAAPAGQEGSLSLSEAGALSLEEAE